MKIPKKNHMQSNAMRAAIAKVQDKSQNGKIGSITVLDTTADSPYLNCIRNPTQPATLSWRPLVLCVLDVILTA
ncbi:hypothetical protein [Parasphingorhabdus cellanae]|uniref:Uncharacterized protein n=1 Tax=Parasphingorhabdus cellanae TaxID=2806553 RepID=A0ABX7T4C6_9SPHN|nr:hypothetical protein [Parasphingorhabdus cellanae]QTD55670.1 hypothetical protein J4G78_15955 [Parasphingorhabdus cellanae]